MDQIKETLKKIWGYDDFRPPQGEIVRCLLEGKDALIILPTGMGKSLCFQIPAILQRGLTLVISPLVALMENQVQELQEKNLPANRLHSQISRLERKNILQQIENQQLRLLYLSPETLLSPPVWEKLINPHLKINGLIIDEAHCLVQWGDTFRPEYRRLGIVRETLLKYKPQGENIAIAAFTATANPQAQTILKNTLKLNKIEKFIANPYRSNLSLNIKIVWTPRGRKKETLKFIESHKNSSGLIYVRNRKDSEEISNFLQEKGYLNYAYHGGLSPEERRNIEQKWLTGKIKFVVCTNAFGMGINKADVGWILHYQAPQLLSEYIQEIGRGGRNGKPADTLTLISEPTGLLNPEDKQKNKYFLENLKKQYQTSATLAQQIPKQGKINQITEEFNQGNIALSLLHHGGIIQWLNPFEYQRLSSVKLNINELINNHQKAYLEMEKYLTIKTCRWQYLLTQFGFTQEALNFRCGNCDNCRKK
jgi:ATP-dependent DNA helicase RecQ